jgi:prepilin-type N-terminal cleavage/methylation domain-containing protein
MFRFTPPNKNKGFTLIELLVVISIIALLSAIVLASLNSARMKGRVASSQVAKDQVKKALALYWTDTGTYPVSSGELVSDEYISSIDPAVLYIPVNYDNDGVMSSCTNIPCSDYFLQTWSSSVDGLAWGPEGTTNVQSTTDGKANTNLLVSLFDSYPAAEYCADLVEDSYDNWYLPAKDELFAAYTLDSGDFPSDGYWSSTEDSGSSGDDAWSLYTSNGSMYNNGKDNQYSVRCLR